MMNIEFPKDLFHLGVEIPRAQVVHEYDGLGQFVDILGIAGRFKGLYRVDDRVIVMKDIVEDGTVFDKQRFLFQKRYRHVLVDPDGAAVGSVVAGKNAEEGGFPAAVAGNEGDLVAFFDMKGNVLEERLDPI